jgi:hypothetical protein
MLVSQPRELEGVDVAELVSESETKETQEGAGPWGRFGLKLTDRSYSFSLRYGGAGRVCTSVYRGSFELRAGRWTALPPHLELSTLGFK